MTPDNYIFLIRQSVVREYFKAVKLRDEAERKKGIGTKEEKNWLVWFIDLSTRSRCGILERKWSWESLYCRSNPEDWWVIITSSSSHDQKGEGGRRMLWSKELFFYERAIKTKNKESFLVVPTGPSIHPTPQKISKPPFCNLQIGGGKWHHLVL